MTGNAQPTAVAPLAATDAVAAAIAAADPLLLVLDFDGVLSELVDEPYDAEMVDGVADHLVGLATAPRTTVVVSSGRMLEDLERRVPAEVLDAGVGLVGGHGTAAHLPGTPARDLADAETARATLDRVEDELRGLVDTDAGWWIERKRVSVGVHYRRVAEEAREDVLEDVRACLASVADEPPGWSVLDGKDIVELRPEGHDKGSALAWLLEVHAPGHVPWTLGDDVTDEDAFRAALDHGGGAVLVAAEGRPSHAAWRIEGPTAVRSLLAALRAHRQP